MRLLFLLAAGAPAQPASRVLDSPVMMRSSLCLAACVILSSFVHAAAAQKLLVVTQRDHSFHVYNAATLEETASAVEDAEAGHEVTATRDGKLALVPIYGNSGVGKPGTDGDHIEIFDIATGKPAGDIKFAHGVRPHKPIWDPHTGMLLVSTEIDKTVSIIDPKSMKIVGTIPTGAPESHMITLLPDGKKLYSANVGPGSVSVMDLPTKKLLKIIPVSKTTQRISNSVDGRYVFTADQTAPELVVIDTAKDEVAKRIKLPAVGYGTAPTPDGKYLLVCMDGEEGMAVVDLKTMETVRTIATPRGIDEVVIAPDSKTAYATSARTDHLVAIDLGAWKVTKSVPTGKFPDGMWLVPAAAR